jgi:hypothetical protein
VEGGEQPGILLNCTEPKSKAPSRARVNVPKMAMSIRYDAMPMAVLVSKLHRTSGALDVARATKWQNQKTGSRAPLR